MWHVSNADPVPYQPSSSSPTKVKRAAARRADLLQPKEAPRRCAVTADSAQPEATTQVSRVADYCISRERGRRRGRRGREKIMGLPPGPT